MHKIYQVAELDECTNPFYCNDLCRPNTKLFEAQLQNQRERSIQELVGLMK